MSYEPTLVRGILYTSNPVTVLMISLIFHELAILRSDKFCVEAPDVAISWAPISDHILTFRILDSSLHLSFSRNCSHIFGPEIISAKMPAEGMPDTWLGSAPGTWWYLTTITQISTFPKLITSLLLSPPLTRCWYRPVFTTKEYRDFGDDLDEKWCSEEFN